MVASSRAPATSTSRSARSPGTARPSTARGAASACRRGGGWGRGKGMPCASSSLSPGPVDVGTAPLDRTPEGVRDLGGNVMEWVQDQFITPYLPECGDCVDPRIEMPVPLQEDYRVLRGGSWGHQWDISRSTLRGRWKRTEA